MICHPNAKINLGLNVTERRPDGYHNLETVFYPHPAVRHVAIQYGCRNGQPPPGGYFPQWHPRARTLHGRLYIPVGRHRHRLPAGTEPAHQGPAPDTGTLCTPPPLYIVA